MKMTKKEENKADLEQLLNSLIQKGWNVFGHRDRINAEKCNYIEGNYYNFDNHNISISLRELVSKESGLWQFVCENRKQGYTMPQGWIKNPKICDEGIESVEKECNQNSYEYYIIESSLKDESELEEFLLSNIVIEHEE